MLLAETGPTLRRLGTPAALLVLVSMALTTGCQSVARATPRGPATGPAAAMPSNQAAPVRIPTSVDVRDLDADERRVLLGVLNAQFDPCGEPISFYEALDKPKPCERALVLAAFCVDLVAKGLSERQIRRELLKELARTTTKVDFDLTGTPVQGDAALEVLVVEFIDFQCPFCKITAKKVKEMARKHKARLAIKHLPLGDHHPYAEEAALTAIAAHLQGKFWPVYDALFAKQSVLSEEVIRKVAVEAGCDPLKLAKDMRGKAKEILARDVEEADAARVDGTPTLYVDGYVVEYDQLESKLRAAGKR